MSVLTVYNPSEMGKEVTRAGRLFVRLSAEDEAYLSLLMAKTGVGKTAVIIQGIRALAEIHKITRKDIREALAKPDTKPTDTGAEEK